MINSRSMELFKIPRLLLLSIVVCYAFPICLELISLDDDVLKAQVEVVWFICMIPSLIFSFYKGFKGAIFSIIFAMILYLVTITVIHDKNFINSINFYLLVVLMIANMIVSVPVSFLVNKLNAEKVKLEIEQYKLIKEKNHNERMAYMDPLTKLFNRRFLEENLPVNLARRCKNNERLSILFIDLDGFKKVNDSFGHMVGDNLLQEVAIILKHSVHENDNVIRLAGDEFIIILPKSNKEKAEKVARKILQDLQKPFEINDNQVSVTSSIGMAIYPEHGQDSETLIKHADKAMYQAKNSGKNTYAVYEIESLMCH